MNNRTNGRMIPMSRQTRTNTLTVQGVRYGLKTLTRTLLCLNDSDSFLFPRVLDKLPMNDDKIIRSGTQISFF